jgi:hypothetical protein
MAINWKVKSVAVLLLFSSTAASALDADLGALGPQVRTFSNSFIRNGNDSGSPLGPYADTYSFTLTDTVTVLGDLNVIQGGRTRLSAALQLTGGDIVDPLVDDTVGTFSFPDLVPGSYALVVHGAFSGLSGVSRYVGRISSGGTLPAVPEPETWVLLMAGLGILGAAVRVRTSSARAAA